MTSKEFSTIFMKNTTCAPFSVDNMGVVITYIYDP